MYIYVVAYGIILEAFIVSNIVFYIYLYDLSTFLPFQVIYFYLGRNIPLFNVSPFIEHLEYVR
jgi:hypothetical protein